MARSHVMRPITGENGDLLYGAQVTVRESGLSVLIAQPLYADATSGAVLPNPFVASTGAVDFWLEEPQRVSVLVQAGGHSDILAYLDAAPPPEETARTDAPLLIVGDQIPGKVLTAGSTPGQAAWSDPPTNSGITPLVTVISEAFALGQDPAGWTLTQAANTTHDYAVDVPDNEGLLHSLHAANTGASGSLSIASPGFTLTETGYVSLWLKTSLAAGEQVVISATNQVGTATTLETITGVRGWGYYRYPLAAGTYQGMTVQFTGASTFTGTGHEIWVTSLHATYGGQVPVHTHAGTGANSVLLGTGANAASAGSVGVGYQANASGVNALAAGYNAQSWGIDSVAVGSGTQATADKTIAIGSAASGNTGGTRWTAIGADAYVDASNGTAIGQAAKVYAADGTAIGSGAYVGSSGSNGVAIGKGAQALAPGGVAIGLNALVAASHGQSLALGAGAASSAAGQIMLGSATSSLSVIVANKLYAIGPVNIGTDATSRLGFYGTEGTVKPVVTGSDGTVLALRALLGALAGLGLITNSTTAP